MGWRHRRPTKAGAVHGEAHRHDWIATSCTTWIIGALQEGGIDGAEFGFMPSGCQAPAAKVTAMLFGNADIEGALREKPSGEQVDAGARRHGERVMATIVGCFRWSLRQSALSPNTF